MKHVVTAAGAAFAAMLLLTTHNAYTQSAAPTDDAEVIVVYSDADAEAVLDARIAALKTVLKLGSDQEKLWPPLEASIRKTAADSMARGKERSETRPPSDFLEVLKRVADAEATRAADLDGFVEAAAPLVALLSEEQKNRMPAFLGMMVDSSGSISADSLWLFEEENR